MVGVSPFARLFYIGMWNYAYCDEGHLPDDVVGLKLKVLPADDVDPAALLGELMGRGRVVRMVAEGRTFLYMPTFKFYQKADQRWKTRCPACALKDSLKLAETQVSLGEHSETHQSSALREEERTREKRREPNPAPAALDLLFDDAWAHWPKKVERKAALAKFKVAAHKMPPALLVEAVKTFGDAYARTTDRQFVPALGVWLNGERWTDELPRRSESGRVSPEERARRTLALASNLKELQ
jgi:hypothetical protein